MSQKLPVLFISHGNPMTVFDQTSAREYQDWRDSLPQARAMLIFSAHWESDSLLMGETVAHNTIIYDFYGFPQQLYELQYPAPAADFLVTPIRQLLGYEVPVSNRGIDHGVWVPLLHMWPKADLPILQMSLPVAFDNRDLHNLGRQLAPLREQGVLIVGAGTLTHNLRDGLAHKYQSPPEWARRFDAWVETSLLNNREQLLIWERVAPNASMNHPSAEHFRPLLVALGAADDDDPVSFPITGYDFQVFSKRSVQFG